jgi:uncharacterized delta-60 repeat protein
MCRSSWWKRLARNVQSPRPAHRKPARAGPAALRLEELEERAVPNAGQLDYSFGTAGKTTIAFNPAQQGRLSVQLVAGVAVQTDGKILLAGSAGALNTTGNTPALARFNADGTVDTTFGNSGQESISFGSNTSGIQALALQSDGKILVAGTSSDSFTVARLTSNGALDTTFGANNSGVAAVAARAGVVAGLAVQPLDGAIVVAGTATPLSNQGVAVMRFSSTGALDTSFGASGVRTVAFGGGFTAVSLARGVALESDGKIVIGGSFGIPHGSSSFGVARLTTGGDLDSTFGSGGVQTVAFATVFGEQDNLSALAIQKDDKILLAGTSGQNNLSTFAMARLKTDGSLDSTFGTGGKFVFSLPLPAGNVSQASYPAPAIALQSDGKSILTNTVQLTPSGISMDNYHGSSDFELARVTTTGTLDTTFGDGGQKLIAVTAGNTSGYSAARAQAVAIQSDGKLIVAGVDTNSASVTSPFDFAVARVLNDGQQTTGRTAALGAYRPSDGSWSLDSDGTFGFDANTDQVFRHFSPPGVTAVAGDWTGSGHASIGDFKDGVWHLDLNGNGKLDAGETFTFGQAGDIPVVGDWNGDGKTDIGVFRPAADGVTGEFILDTTETHQYNFNDLSFTFGLATDRIVVGDWTGTGTSKVGVYRDATAFGAPGAAVFSLDAGNHHTFDSSSQVFIFGRAADGVVIGDWNGDGISKVGVYRDGSEFGAPGVALFSLDTNGNRHYDPGVDAVFLYGFVTDQFVAGNWKVTPPLQPPLRAADGVGPGGADPLTGDQLAPVLRQAVAFWAARGADADRLASVRVQIAQLSGDLLGLAGSGVITVSADAAGWGWFVDPTPDQDEEFALTAADGLHAQAGSPAAGKVDLLTVLEHELGHELGLPDLDPASNPGAVLDATLPTGVRRIG